MIARVARAARGGDYADQNTRTDYLTFSHFVDLSQPTRGVTISNWDSPFFVAGLSTVTQLDTTPMIRAVVGVQADGAGQAIPNQGGDTRFLDRFSLRTHGAYDPAAAMRFALEHQNPLVPVAITGGADAPLPADQWSLLALTSPDILLWALKPAEEGMDYGIIARVWNLAEGPRDLRLWLVGRGLGRARNMTHIETDLGDAPTAGDTLVDHLARQQMRTYCLRPSQWVTGAPGAAPIGISPNPLHLGSTSSVSYDLPTQGRVRITLHDVRGAIVATLADGVQAAGSHLVRWDGRDARGAVVAPGVYLLRVQAASRVSTSRLVFLR